MTSSAKRVCVTRSDTTGTDEGDVADFPSLPPELVDILTREWYWSEDLPFVTTLRTLGTAFASALSHRVYTHTPDVQLFYRELQLMRIYHLTQRRLSNGSHLYFKAFHMIWRRYHEKNPGGADGIERGLRMRAWYDELCLWVQARIEIMPQGWGPWVGRIHHTTMRYLVSHEHRAPLDLTFQRMWDGDRIGDGGPDPRRDERFEALVVHALLCLNVTNGDHNAAIHMFHQANQGADKTMLALAMQRARDQHAAVVDEE